MIRKTLNLALLGFVFMVFTFFTGCVLIDDDDDDDDGGGCISCGETITWTSYGRYEFNNAGSDRTAWDIVDNCGWHIHSGHRGGYGDTLQVASCASQDCPPETDNPYETYFIEDYCDVALYIPYLPFRGSGNTIDTTIDEDEPNLSCIYSEHHNSVWYYFEADRDGYVTADTSGSDFDTVATAFQGNCSDLEEIACDDDSGVGLASEVIFPVSVGETYYLLVGSYYTDSGGNLALSVNFRECLPQEEGVVLVWAYQSFKGFRVRKSWTGSTIAGIRIGSTLQEFLSTYTYFAEQSDSIFLYEEGNIKVKATFDQNEQLEELMVGRYFRN